MLRGLRKIAAVLARLHSGQAAQTLAEYALILTLILVVSLAALTLLGLAISGHLGDVTAALG